MILRIYVGNYGALLLLLLLLWKKWVRSGASSKIRDDQRMLYYREAKDVYVSWMYTLCGLGVQGPTSS